MKELSIEDKELLLKDLYARLPYGVCVHIRYKEGEPCYGRLTPRDIQWFIDSNIENIKPYLRPIPSMTEEENWQYIDFIESSYNDYTSESTPCIYLNRINEYIDWLNSHHFDYRGLIEKGLALEAPKDMYNL